MANDTGSQHGISAGTGSAPEAFAIRVLQLEDVPTDAELIRRRLLADGLDIVCRVEADEAGFRKALVEFAPQIVLSDFSLPRFRRPCRARDCARAGAAHAVRLRVGHDR